MGNIYIHIYILLAICIFCLIVSGANASDGLLWYTAAIIRTPDGLLWCTAAIIRTPDGLLWWTAAIIRITC